MKYLGSKGRIAKQILPIILKGRKKDQWYVEPFIGGANMIDKVQGRRAACDSNIYIAAMWRAIIKGWTPPEIDKSQYQSIKENPDFFDPPLVGWAGVACSYSGKWFGGFAGVTKTAGGVRDYQKEAFTNLEKQRDKLKGVWVRGCSYSDLFIPPRSIIYCDPPYANTTKYKDNFDHSLFWQWCRDMSDRGHTVFISEYSAPNDFVCIWQQELKSSLSANGKYGGSKNSTEKLFVYAPFLR